MNVMENCAQSLQTIGICSIGCLDLFCRGCTGTLGHAIQKEADLKLNYFFYTDGWLVECDSIRLLCEGKDR